MVGPHTVRVGPPGTAWDRIKFFAGDEKHLENHETLPPTPSRKREGERFAGTGCHLSPSQWLPKPATSQLPKLGRALRALWSPASGGEGEDFFGTGYPGRCPGLSYFAPMGLQQAALRAEIRLEMKRTERKHDRN